MRVFSRMKRFSTVSMHDQTLLGFFFSSIAESFDVFAILAVEKDTRYMCDTKQMQIVTALKKDPIRNESDI